MQRRGLVLLATMSESDTIEAVLQEVAESVTQLQRFGWVFEVLVVDDGGDRAFHSLCTKLGAEYGLSLRVVEGPRAGLGGAILHGFDVALSDPGIDYIVNLDADGQHDARQMGDLLRAHVAADADITIGSRWTRGGSSPGTGVNQLLDRLDQESQLRVRRGPLGDRVPQLVLRLLRDLSHGRALSAAHLLRETR